MDKTPPPKNVRELLHRLPLSLESFAEQSGGKVPLTTLAKWWRGERKNPRAGSLDDLAEALEEQGEHFAQMAEEARRLATERRAASQKKKKGDCG